MGDRVGLLHPQIWSDFTKIFTRDNILVNIYAGYGQRLNMVKG